MQHGPFSHPWIMRGVQDISETTEYPLLVPLISRASCLLYTLYLHSSLNKSTHKTIQFNLCESDRIVEVQMLKSGQQRFILATLPCRIALAILISHSSVRVSGVHVVKSSARNLLHMDLSAM